jgi:hypothetical protein
VKLARILVCCAVVAAAPALAQKACSKADSAAAEKAIDKVVNWSSLYKAYTDYRHCDTDSVGDIFTDAILRLMVEWKHVDQIAGTVAKDGEYKAWLQKHLQSPAAKGDVEDVYSRARLSCPSTQKDFCTELAEMVKPGKGAAPVTPAKPADELDLSPLKPLKTS